ncbi:MAG: MBL fold metallo-hydrolase [Elusimicrobia bacterium]|nr:MBL fold metallo-hydrolase [Elusimicrobiota bacterium]
MTKLTFYGGVNEIGGNKILLEAGNTKIFLDFGMSFLGENKFFEFPLLRPANIDDLRKINVIPEIKGLYKNTGLNIKYQPNGDFTVEGIPENRQIDAILLTHGHLDHSGYLGLVRPDIPIYLSAATKKFLKLRSDINKNWESDVHPDSFSIMERDEEKKIGRDIAVRRFDVDHSVIGASAYLVHTKDKTIAYTGDFRFHGYRQKETEHFLKALLKQKIDILITEGTRLSRTEEEKAFETEEEVFSAAAELTKKEKGLVIYDASPADIDRVRTLARVAKETGRTLVLDDKKAYFILYLNYNEPKNIVEGLPGINDFKIYLSRGKLKTTSKKYCNTICADENLYIETFTHDRKGYQRTLLAKQILASQKSTEDYNRLIGGIKKSKNAEEFFKAISIPAENCIWGPIGREEILKNSGKYILYTSNGPLTLLQFIPANKKVPGTYIYGKAEPFNEEMEISHDKLKNWIDLAGLKMKYAHTSGHISEKDLRRFIKEVNPGCVMPVHTEKADMFDTFGIKVIKPELKKPLHI